MRRQCSQLDNDNADSATGQHKNVDKSSPLKYFFVQEWFVSIGKGDCLSALLGRHHKVLHQTDSGLKSVALKYKKYPLDNPVPCCSASKPLRRALRPHGAAPRNPRCAAPQNP